MSSLGEFIKVNRESCGLSQKQLGSICGISDAAIQRIESGKTKAPKWEHLCIIAQKIHLHPLELLVTAGYITDEEINPNIKLHGLEKLSDDDFDCLQSYIDFLIFRKHTANNA